MWTKENPPSLYCDRLRDPSDLTDLKWEEIKRLIPPAKCGGGKCTVEMREVVNGVMQRPEQGLPVARHPKRPATTQR